jgi:hypothetical protein
LTDEQVKEIQQMVNEDYVDLKEKAAAFPL